MGALGSPRQEIQQICDGSDAARFVYAATMSYGEVFTLFTAAHGSQYLVVDGHCEGHARDLRSPAV